MTATRVIAYTPNGASLGPVPAPQDLSVGYPLNDLGALTMAYPPDAPRSDLLGQPLELAVEVSWDGGMTWQEPASSRFLYLRDGRDPIKTADAFQVEAVAYLQRLQKALVGFVGLDENGVRTFTNATPGAILRALFDAAQARGALTGVTLSVTNAADTGGAAWGATYTISYEPGKDLLSILQDMAAAGWVDFRTQGRSIQVYRPDGGMAADRSAGANPVSLRYGRDLTEAPFRRTWEALADTAMILGDNGAHVERTNGAALKPWGRQETYVTASGVADAGTLQVVGDAALTLTANERTEHTFGVDFSVAPFLPFRDYAPGEWVLAAVDGNAPQRMRVRQVTLTRDNQGAVGGNVVLNDRFLESDVLTQRRIQALTQGATQAGTGTTPSPVGNDILRPAPPTGLTADSAAYLTPSGTVQANVILDWADVTTNADGTPITDLAGYRVSWKPQASAAWRLLTTTAVSSLTLSPFDPGQDLSFRVTAYDTVGNESDPSAAVNLTTATDTTPPATPSAPDVTSPASGSVSVSWDGLDDLGNPLADPDLARVEAHAMLTGAALPTPGDTSTLLGAFVGPGQFVANGLPVDAVRWVRLVAIDTSRNASDPSAATQVTVARSSDGLVPVPPAGWTATLAPLGIMALQATWPAVENADAVTYDVYLAQVDPDTGAGLADPPDPAAYYGSTAATGMGLDHLPDGTPFTGTEQYSVRVVPRDADGPSATASLQGVASPREADETSISRDYVYAGLIEAAQMKSGALEATLAILGALTTAADGRNVSLSSEDGLRAQDQDENTLFHVPTDPALNLRMLLDAILLSATVTGPLSMRSGSDKPNELAQNAVLVLRSGTSAPVTAPSVKVVWPEVRLPGTTTADDQYASWRSGGAHIDSGLFYQAWYTWGASGIQWFDPDTAAAIGGFNMPTQHYALSVVRIGTKLYVYGWRGDLYKNNNPWSPRVYLWRFSLAGVKEAENEVYASVDFSTRQQATMGLLSDGAHLVLALPDPSTDRIILNIMDPATLGQTSSGALNYAIGNQAITSVLHGTFDFGGTRYIITTKDRSGGDLILVFNPATANRESTLEWPGANNDLLGGLAWDPVDLVFKQWSRSRQVLYTYAGNYWVGTTQSWKVCHAWVDNDPAPGDHFTAMGPYAALTMKKRASIQVTTPPIPSDPDVNNHDDPSGVAIYVSQAGTARTDFFMNPGTDHPLADGVITTRIDRPVFSNADTFHPNPVVAGNFPAATPARITSDAGVHYFDGQGVLVAKSVTELQPNPIPFARGFRTGVAGSYASGTWLAYATGDTQALRGGITYNAADGSYTVPEDGVYKIVAQVAWAANATGYRGVAVTAGGSTYYGYDFPNTAAMVGMAQVSVMVYLAAGSVVSPLMRQQSGAALGLDLTPGFGFVQIAKMGA